MMKVTTNPKTGQTTYTEGLVKIILTHTPGGRRSHHYGKVGYEYRYVMYAYYNGQPLHSLTQSFGGGVRRSYVRALVGVIAQGEQTCPRCKRPSFLGGKYIVFHAGLSHPIHRWLDCEICKRPASDGYKDTAHQYSPAKTWRDCRDGYDFLKAMPDNREGSR